MDIISLGISTAKFTITKFDLFGLLALVFICRFDSSLVGAAVSIFFNLLWIWTDFGLFVIIYVFRRFWSLALCASIAWFIFRASLFGCRCTVVVHCLFMVILTLCLLISHTDKDNVWFVYLICKFLLRANHPIFRKNKTKRRKNRNFTAERRVHGIGGVVPSVECTQPNIIRLSPLHRKKTCQVTLNS